MHTPLNLQICHHCFHLLSFLLLSCCLLQHCRLQSCHCPNYLFQCCLLLKDYCLWCCLFLNCFLQPCLLFNNYVLTCIFLKYLLLNYIFVFMNIFFNFSPSLVTIVISPSGHHNWSSNIHVESPMSLNKFVDLSDFPDTKLNLDLLYQCPPFEKFKKYYDRMCKFQLEWATKLPWVEGVLPTYDILHNVQCRVCHNIDPC
jgi:hypothetical protein